MKEGRTWSVLSTSARGRGGESSGCCCSSRVHVVLQYTQVLFTRGREGRDGWLPREANNLIVAFCLIPIIPDYKYLSFPIDAIIKELYLSLRKYQISDKLGL